jgi:hypothetical protein
LLVAIINNNYHCVFKVHYLTKLVITQVMQRRITYCMNIPVYCYEFVLATKYQVENLKIDKHNSQNFFRFSRPRISIFNEKAITAVQCVRKVAVHLGYGTYVWLSVSKLPLKCAVVSLYSVVKRRLKCNTGKVCNCLTF